MDCINQSAHLYPEPVLRAFEPDVVTLKLEYGNLCMREISASSVLIVISEISASRVLVLIYEISASSAVGIYTALSKWVLHGFYNGTIS